MTLRLNPKVSTGALYALYIVTPIFIVFLFSGNSTLSLLADFMVLVEMGLLVVISREFDSSLIYLNEEDVDIIPQRLDDLGFKIVRQTRNATRFRFRENMVKWFRAKIKYEGGWIILIYPSKFDEIFLPYKRF